MLDMLANSNTLFLAGMALIILSVIGAIVSTVILRVSSRRLRAKLEGEFGKKRR